MKQIEVVIVLDVIHCPACQIVFAITADTLQRRRDTRDRMWCPNGHEFWYGADGPSKRNVTKRSLPAPSKESIEEEVTP